MKLTSPRRALKPILLTLMLLASATGLNAAQRPTESLDGKWEFRFAPDDRGTARQWFSANVAYDRFLKVPGCWDVQGVGKPTQKMRHNAIGVGWYRRTFTVPAAWHERRVWLVIGGVHRTAKIWLNGEFVGEHIGYPVSFRLDITDKLKPGKQSLAIAVDSRHDLSRDPLVGTFDVIDFMDLDWGGIQEHVFLESTGETWIDDAFVQPDPAHRRAELELTLGGVENDALLSASIRSDAGKILAQHQENLTNSTAELTFDLPNAPFWTPENPALLTLELKLTRDGKTLDTKEVRFGLRKLETKDGHFVLNGSPFFLRGYGDDFNFPRELLPPANVAFWKKYLQKRKEFGFNGVRHHSMMPTESYLAAADEVGMFVQPELPIAYYDDLNRATPEGREVYKQVWQQYIRQMRNHPSVMAWCMGNEMWAGIPFGGDLYKTAKALDPTRLVIDSDGLLGDANRPTLDYRSVQFSEGTMPWGDTLGKYCVTNNVGKPVLVHEMGNISCLPDPSEAARCNGAIEPFWLEEMQAAVKRQGLENLLPAMLQSSWRLQASLIKLNMEQARLGPGIDGYYQWLFRDYWCQSSGIESIIGTTRALTRPAIRQFNSDAVILWADRGANYHAGEAIPLSLVLSDFRPVAAPRIGKLTMRLEGNVVELNAPANAGARGAIGKWTGELTAPGVRKPERLTLIAQAGDVQNAWPIWIWPAAPECGTNVLVAKKLTPQILEQLKSGANVLLTHEELVFPSQIASFKTAWWKGDEHGDFVHGNFFVKHPAIAGFPNDGYGDLDAYGILNNGLAVNLDEVPGHIEPIVWALDVPAKLRRMAYLWEARVGRGKLLVSGFNLDVAERNADPAAAWMYALLTRYASSHQFQPKATLPAEWLEQKVSENQLPDAKLCVEGFNGVAKSTAEKMGWHTDREMNAEIYVVRQTDGQRALTWRTATVPSEWHHENVIFVWSGGIGFHSEPAGGPFELSMNGEKICDIPFVTKSAQWKCKDGMALRYFVSRKAGEDSFGLFFLKVPSDKVRGHNVELTLTAPARASKRWISVAPYEDVVKNLASQ
jgi:beta-galactosidase